MWLWLPWQRLVFSHEDSCLLRMWLILTSSPLMLTDKVSATGVPVFHTFHVDQVVCIGGGGGLCVGELCTSPQARMWACVGPHDHVWISPTCVCSAALTGCRFIWFNEILTKRVAAPFAFRGGGGWGHGESENFLKPVYTSLISQHSQFDCAVNLCRC